VLKYMLDTDIVIYTIKNKPDHMRETFRGVGSTTDGGAIR
jgi:hypothetical protein